jgi:hypothetical protein
MALSAKLVGLVALISTAIAKPALKVRGDTPQYFVDPATTKYCTWYHDNADGAISCTDVPGAYGSSWEDFLRWVCMSSRVAVKARYGIVDIFARSAALPSASGFYRASDARLEAPLHLRFDANARPRILPLAAIVPATVPSSPTA